MGKHPKECFARLIVGLGLNVALWLIDWKEGGPHENIRIVIAGCLAVATWVFVVPVFWRGLPWQVPIAFVLLFYFPGITLVSVVSKMMSNW